MAAYFVDSTTGNDANDGLDNIGLRLLTATWTEATLTLNHGAIGYTFALGDVIYINAGTGATVGLYEVTASTSTTTTIAATSSLPEVGDGNDFAAGDLGTGDIASSNGPKLTITGSEDIPVAPGDTVFIRGLSVYSETVTLDVAGGSDTNIIKWRGYKDVLDDNSRAFIDGTTGNAIGGGTGRDYRVFENLDLTANAGVAITNLGGTTTDRNVWKNVRWHDAAIGIVNFNDYCFFERCIFENLAGAACHGNLFVTVIGCVFKNCTGADILRGESVFVFDTLMYDVGANSMAIRADFTGVNMVIGCTLYGSQGGSDTAITLGAAGHLQLVMHNNIITHWTTGVDLNDDWGNGWNIGFNNVLYDNTADYEVNSGATSSKFTHTGEVTTNPSLVDPAGDDYTIPASGGAFEAGLTGFDVDGANSRRSIGASTPAAGASGGGLLMPNKRGGKQ